MSFKIGVSRDKEGQRQRRTNSDQKMRFHPMPPSEGLKMLVSTMMAGHDDENHVDGPFEMATWDVLRAHFYGEVRRWIYTFLPEGHEQVGKVSADACTERVM